MQVIELTLGIMPQRRAEVKSKHRADSVRPNGGLATARLPSHNIAPCDARGFLLFTALPRLVEIRSQNHEFMNLGVWEFMSS